MGSGVGLGSESEKSGSLPKSPGFNLVGEFWGIGEGSDKGDVKQPNWAVVIWGLGRCSGDCEQNAWK